MKVMLRGPNCPIRFHRGGCSMALPQHSPTPSWFYGDTPLALSEIVSEQISVAIWQRDKNKVISDYFSSVFGYMGLGIRTVFAMDSLKQGLQDALPDGEGKAEVIEDIYLLADMLTCLFDCENVGLRLAPLSAAMCPNFHVDKIPVRLVNTYLGDGTEWLPVEALCESPNDESFHKTPKALNKGYYKTDSLQQMNAFDVALLKGSAWPDHEHMAAVHRSCALADNEKRVLLTLDPV